MEYNEQDLAKPLPDDTIWLVAEVDGRIAGWIYAHLLAPTTARFSVEGSGPS
jgi:hypothetical protein